MQKKELKRRYRALIAEHDEMLEQLQDMRKDRSEYVALLERVLWSGINEKDIPVFKQGKVDPDNFTITFYNELGQALTSSIIVPPGHGVAYPFKPSLLMRDCHGFTVTAPQLSFKERRLQELESLVEAQAARLSKYEPGFHRLSPEQEIKVIFGDNPPVINSLTDNQGNEWLVDCHASPPPPPEPPVKKEPATEEKARLPIGRWFRRAAR